MITKFRTVLLAIYFLVLLTYNFVHAYSVLFRTVRKISRSVTLSCTLSEIWHIYSVYKYAAFSSFIQLKTRDGKEMSEH
jgi:hypothetical protein